MDKIIRTFEENILDAGKLEKEVEQLKKLRSDIDRKISEKERSPVMMYKKYQNMLPQLQREIQMKKDSGLEEPISEDDKQDYMITRSELADLFAKHFVDSIWRDEMPFQGLASLFGINIPENSQLLEGRGKESDGIHRVDAGARPLVVPFSSDIKQFPSAVVMNGAWQTIIKWDHFRERYDVSTEKKAAKNISLYLQQGILPKKFLEWMGNTSGYVQEMTRRGVASVEWKFMVDFLKHGSCSLKTGMCDVCGTNILENSKFSCEFCKLGSFCSAKCKELYVDIHKPLCYFINSKVHNLDIKWDDKAKLWVKTSMTDEEKSKAKASPKSKLESAILLKKEGNDFFKSKHYKAAMDSYNSGLDTIEDLKKKGTDDQELKKELCTVNLSFLVNMSQCELKQKDFSAALNRCNKILAIESTNSKAMFVGAKALSALKQNDTAIKYFLEAMKLDPTIASACEKEVRILKKNLKK